jgi:hypothetical protein
MIGLNFIVGPNQSIVILSKSLLKKWGQSYKIYIVLNSLIVHFFNLDRLINVFILNKLAKNGKISSFESKICFLGLALEIIYIHQQFSLLTI